MATLQDALELLGYDLNKSKSLIQIFHITGIFDGKSHEQQLTESELQEKLQSNLGLEADATAIAIAQEFNRLGQEKFKEIRGKGERQEMKKIEIPERFLSHFEALEMSQEVKPPLDAELYFVFGASEAGLRNRIGFLRENLGDDIKNKQIVFLGGNRKLWPKYTGDDEHLLQYTSKAENITFELISKLNPEIDIEDFKKEVNLFFEGKKQDLTEGKIDITQIRKEIIEKLPEGAEWPTESDLAIHLADEILGVKDAKIIEGKIDPNTGRPTTDTNLKAIPGALPDIIKAQPEVCFVSSQPYVNRQTALAKFLSCLNNVTGCGRGATSLLDSKNISPMLEATLGEVNSLVAIRTKEQDRSTSQPATSIVNPTTAAAASTREAGR